MKVRKKDGRIQDFNVDKIKLTLERVSDEVQQPFTASDIRRLTEAIEDVIRGYGKDVIDSSEIQRIVVKELEKSGFSHIAKAYDQFEKRFDR